MAQFQRHLETLGIAADPDFEHQIEIEGADPILGSRFHIGEAAAIALALGARAASRLRVLAGTEPGRIHADVGHAAASLLGFLLQARTDGAASSELTRSQPATIGIFRTADGRHIHLHGGFPHLHTGTLDLLGCADDAGSIAAAVARRDAVELEDALADAGLCGAVVRSPEEWDAHAQGRALRTRPVVSIERVGDAPVHAPAKATRPLEGMRVLDLTRVLAGPTCGRTLALYGADVLRVGAARLPVIAAFVHETGHGKRSTFLDLDARDDRAKLDALIDGADVFVDGFRGGALAGRGLSTAEFGERRPGIVHVNIRCYGDHGPWAGRRGWEQLAQSATGIAWLEGGAETPRLIPAAATDYTTGYLAAFGAIEALRRRAIEGGSWRVEVSLSRTAMWLRDIGADLDPDTARGLPPLESIRELAPHPDGDVLRVSPPVSLSNCELGWRHDAGTFGADRAEWLP